MGHVHSEKNEAVWASLRGIAGRKYAEACKQASTCLASLQAENSASNGGLRYRIGWDVQPLIDAASRKKVWGEVHDALQGDKLTSDPNRLHEVADHVRREMYRHASARGRSTDQPSELAKRADTEAWAEVYDLCFGARGAMLTSILVEEPRCAS